MTICIPNLDINVVYCSLQSKRKCINCIVSPSFNASLYNMSEDKTNANSPKKLHFSLKSQLQQMGSGAISSALTRFFCQPLEVLKIRFQLQVEPLVHDPSKGSKYKSLRQAIVTIFKEEGITAFWRGHNAGQMLSFVYGVSQFWGYEQIWLDLSQREFFRTRPNYNRFMSGALSGAMATVISMPFDVIRTRLVSQDIGSGYRSATGAIPRILKEEGIRGFYRGLGTSLIQIGPLVGVNFVLYGILNDLALNVFQVETKKNLPVWYLLFSGGLAGTVSKVLTYPLDFIKRRLQIQGFLQHRQTYGKNMRCDGIWQCARLTIRDEGVLGFYKGMAPTLLKSGVTTALFFGLYDTVKIFLIAVTGK